MTNCVFCDASASGATCHDNSGAVIHDCVPMTCFETVVAKLSAAPNQFRKLFPDPEKLKPFFGWVLTDEIKTVLDKLTQHHCNVTHFPFRMHFKSRCPGANVPRLNEWMATDAFFNNAPAMDDGIPGHGGCTMMQVFCGLTSGTVHGYPMRCKKQVGQAFKDHIRKVGAPIREWSSAKQQWEPQRCLP